MKKLTILILLAITILGISFANAGKATANQLLKDVVVFMEEDVEATFDDQADRYYEAIETGDYSVWKNLADKEMLEIIDTEEKFQKLVKLENLYKQAEELETELFGNYYDDFEDEEWEGEDDYWKAIEEGDYEAWKNLEDKEILEIIDTEEKFKALQNIEKLYEEGNYEEAERLERELFGDYYEEIYGDDYKEFEDVDWDYDEEWEGEDDMDWDAYDKAIEDRDYNAWKVLEEGEILEIIDTEEKFLKLIEMEKLYEEGNYEEAEKLEVELFGDYQ